MSDGSCRRRRARAEWPTTLATCLRLRRKERIQLRHLHSYAASTLGRLAGLLTGVPTVIHDYDTEVYFPYPSYLSLADRLLAPVTRRATMSMRALPRGPASPLAASAARRGAPA